MPSPKADYSQLALPKPGVRVRDEQVLDEARARPRCERCKTPCCPADPHHIRSRGAGGGDTHDNVVSLCRKCHDLAHWGRIGKVELYAIAATRSDEQEPRQPAADAVTAQSPAANDPPSRVATDAERPSPLSILTPPGNSGIAEP